MGCAHPGLTCSAHPYAPATPHKIQASAKMGPTGFRDKDPGGQVLNLITVDLLNSNQPKIKSQCLKHVYGRQGLTYSRLS